MELKIGLSKNKEEQPEPTMRTTLGGVGVKVIGGERFDARIKRILEYYEELFKIDPAILEKLSTEKEWVLEQVYKRLKFIFGTGIPWGYPMDNKYYSDAVEAVIDLLLLAKNLALSRTSNQTALLISHDYFSRCDILVGKSFGRENTALDTPIIIQQTLTKGSGGEGALDPALKAALLKQLGQTG